MSSFSIFLALIIFVSFLLVLVIMVQNPKGGGLSSSFGGDSQQIGGVKKVLVLSWSFIISVFTFSLIDFE